jgi:hypothetical protein
MPVHIGVPQGSVLGPLCWSIAVAPLILRLREVLAAQAPGNVGARGGGPERWTGLAFFADDGIAWASGPDDKKLLAVMTAVVAEIAAWASEQGISISVAKSRVHVFHRRARDELTALMAAPLQVTDDLAIQVTDEPMRFLGVLLDHALLMTAHVTAALARAETSFRALAVIGDMLSPATARALYMTMVFGAITYAAEVWLPACGSAAGMQLDTFHNKCARWITGCVAGTSSAAALAEAGLLSLGVMVQRRALTYMHRLARHDGDTYGPRIALERPIPNFSWSQKSPRVWRPAVDCAKYAPLPLAEAIGPTELITADRVHFWTQPTTPAGRKAEHDAEALKHFNEQQLRRIRFRDDVPEPHWVLATDGSVTPAQPARPATATTPATAEAPARTAGAAILQFASDTASVVPPRPQPADANPPLAAPAAPKFQASARGDPRLCSYTAEILAMTIGLDLFIETTLTHEASILHHHAAAPTAPPPPLWILTDSQSLLAALERGPCADNEVLLVRVWRRLLQIAQRRIVKLAFVYSHVGLELNEEADALADAALNGPEPTEPQEITATDAARTQRREAKELALTGTAYDNYDGYRMAVYGSYRPLVPLRVPRAIATPIYRLRTGAAPALGYWKLREHIYCSVCRTRISRGESMAIHPIGHFLTCRAFEAARALLPAPPPPTEAADRFGQDRGILQLAFSSREAPQPAAGDEELRRAAATVAALEDEAKEIETALEVAHTERVSAARSYARMRTHRAKDLDPAQVAGLTDAEARRTRANAAEETERERLKVNNSALRKARTRHSGLVAKIAKAARAAAATAPAAAPAARGAPAATRRPAPKGAEIPPPPAWSKQARDMFWTENPRDRAQVVAAYNAAKPLAVASCPAMARTWAALLAQPAESAADPAVPGAALGDDDE